MLSGFMYHNYSIAPHFFLAVSNSILELSLKGTLLAGVLNPMVRVKGEEWIGDILSFLNEIRQDCMLFSLVRVTFQSRKP
jgi:hypothetical protein